MVAYPGCASSEPFQGISDPNIFFHLGEWKNVNVQCPEFVDYPDPYLTHLLFHDDVLYWTEMRNRLVVCNLNNGTDVYQINQFANRRIIRSYFTLHSVRGELQKSNSWGIRRLDLFFSN